ncbi:MAG: hypothetical protein QOF31_2046, partial [Mycobacterium sp.]|nr:hypothetical protein [Mycobacterium sp.]
MVTAQAPSQVRNDEMDVVSGPRAGVKYAV